MAGEDLGTNYAATYDGHLTPGSRPALLLVDMVRAYTAEGSPFYCATASAAVEVAAQLAATARSAGLPVIFTTVEYEPGGANGGLFYRKVPALKAFDAGSPLGEFPAGLQPQGDDLVVTKQYPSAFFGTALAERLREWDVDTLVIGGFSTSGCVRASTLDALQYGFAPFVVREACADRHETPHEANLFDLQAKYAEVISQDIAAQILRGTAQK
ncbi:isochorismatase family protein [Qipengyuania sp. 6B39]|uniref:isochorismatase family protein n=1 Tax=Qipengyuania proteolytica TaxID=2867239 RepID=UPI001C89805F|nr:isochorismatase family protein [Qipengyuania proteolytica]MBX7495125.1 isochorismatase family protein [Qipengyuania proteolytica]